jgi:hypothetical protein
MATSRPSPPWFEAMMMASLTPDQARIAKLALRLRYYQHTIAAFFGINQGRISEFKNSAAYKAVEPADELPPGFPRLQ